MKQYTLIKFVLLLLFNQTVAFGSPDTALAKEKLEDSIAELSEIRARISSEREPQAADLRRLENEVIELRRERERMERMVDNQSVDMASLENQIKAYDDESTYVVNLLADYFNRVNASLGVAEIPLFQPAFLEVLGVAEERALTSYENIARQMTGIESGLERSESLIGGLRVEGEAVLPGGEVGRGTMGIMGPMTYFSSNDREHAGIVVRGASERAALIEFDPKVIPEITEFLADGTGLLPIDPTLGRALAIATADETLTEHFLKGGLWMYPIAFFAVFATLIALLKVIQISGTKDISASKLEEILKLVREEKTSEAVSVAKSLPGPGARMVAQGLANMRYSKELMEEFLFEIILEEKPRLERGIPFVMLAASVAPLLGLLGTVTGMIETFKLLTLFGTGDAKSLSSGISQALITTEFGLVAAIPSLIMAALIGRMAAAKIGGLEKLLLQFSNGIAAIKEAKAEAAAA